jgi:hypothetical protein
MLWHLFEIYDGLVAAQKLTILQEETTLDQLADYLIKLNSFEL